MYNEKIMEHFVNPKNLGKIKNPDAQAIVGNPQCGDIFSLYLKIDPSIGSGQDIMESKIADIKFETLGCVAAISVSSMVTEIAKGKTLAQAEKIDFQDINKELGFLPPVKVHCAQMAIRALRKAIEEYLVRNNKTQITNDK
ncbi:MAG: iron-sulfur cluster assembly scaffold protein [Candidatus Portnoybacteria bacterium CG06_land_8_20_14_3_00_39_12]|uniref:Iron-sulfur cluster assembly scaffold protein n=3 Tax=Candidatus Portnoyibacteriota TaxID=1817913 RepID=A0A2M7UI87_9BACT|nr:MAG: hypothetical protein AUJ33_02065 [Parcubacteria group bacterium CG1_02_40_25]PIU75438.1 MAG: iron-sulfur cluster assembly scaffold protein [Candidatus Portnoybacteria bacterium CG06_land_8_20_14_3_00_39_12]PIZ70927.1 MAG: iron-sulfur cluster assembly scaffold protein [Candidatus Portnoybacteria bacterium CG_4_10_14_0_2_um_filter_39_11]